MTHFSVNVDYKSLKDSVFLFLSVPNGYMIVNVSVLIGMKTTLLMIRRIHACVYVKGFCSRASISRSQRDTGNERTPDNLLLVSNGHDKSSEYASTA